MQSPVLIIPWGCMPDTVLSVERQLRDALFIKPAVWLSEALPSEDEIANEKRFIVFVVGPKISQAKTSSKGKIVGRDFDRLGKIVAAAPSLSGIVISENDVSSSSLNVIKIDASDNWKRELTCELTRVRAVMNPSELPDRIGQIIRQLNASLLEREEPVRLCVLSALAGESIFLLGPPGVAKSLIARRIKELFPAGAKAFEYLMNRFSTPDEIFGPVSIIGLKSDRLERKTASYLPGADVVFLDEIWKAGPSIQNALLTAINERIFRNDGVDQPIPMRALISASNELPRDDEGLEALWDRFLVRLELGNIQTKENRHEMIRGGSQMEVIVDEARFAKSELASLDHQIDNVAIPPNVLDIIDDIIPRIEKFNHELLENWKQTQGNGPTDTAKPRTIYVSDRRWKKIGRLLRAAALCHGRSVVNELDCYLIAYCIWNDQEHIRPAQDMVKDAIESDRTLERLRWRWKQLQKEAAALPAIPYIVPTLYPPKHYKINLSINGDLLVDDQYGSFSRLPKGCYESLEANFTHIHLLGPGERQANLLAKKGPTPADIILMKTDGSPPLKAFKETGFQLTHTPKARTGSTVDLSNESTQNYLDKLNELRASIDAQKQNAEFFSNTHKHLFVDLPSDVIDRWSSARLTGPQQLDLLLREVIKFAKERGLESG
jgi:MoxR-like ATPase